MTELHYLIPLVAHAAPESGAASETLGFSALGLKMCGTRLRPAGWSGLSPLPNSRQREATVHCSARGSPSEIEPVTGRLHLLYEDTHLLIVDKPAGMVVHPGPGHHGDTLGNLLMGHYAQEGEQHLFRLVNQLDLKHQRSVCVAKHALPPKRLGSLAAEGADEKGIPRHL